MSATSHHRFASEDLVRFLEAVDQCLEGEGDMTLVGGGAVSIAYMCENVEICQTSLDGALPSLTNTSSLHEYFTKTGGF